jgi:hypothetical protein
MWSKHKLKLVVLCCVCVSFTELLKKRILLHGIVRLPDSKTVTVCSVNDSSLTFCVVFCLCMKILTSKIFDSFVLYEVRVCRVLFFFTCISSVVFLTCVFWSDVTSLFWLLYWRSVGNTWTSCQFCELCTESHWKLFYFSPSCLALPFIFLSMTQNGRNLCVTDMRQWLKLTALFTLFFVLQLYWSIQFFFLISFTTQGGV